jgi:hypothetical protein
MADGIFLDEDAGRVSGLVLLPMPRSRHMAEREDGLGSVVICWRDGGITGGNAPVGDAGGASFMPPVGVGGLGGRGRTLGAENC